MSGAAAIRISQVSKKFGRSLPQSIRYGVTDIARNALGLRAASGRLRPGEFWAVSNLSFELAAGETVGIIGANGSGKSTTLKMLNGIFLPDTGRISIAGRVGALIELEAGFHPMLTGRQNAYVNGAILGVPKRTMDRLIDDIVEFSGIGDFIDSPVKYYSSGMRARLGFSIAMNIDPDILLVDEVLSVGDASFRAKSYERMMTFRERGKTICFVSHDMMGINAICRTVVWLDKGSVRLVGPPPEVIPRYLADQEQRLVASTGADGAAASEAAIMITRVETLNQAGVTKDFRYRDRLIIRVHYRAHGQVARPFFMMYVIAMVSNEHVFNANMLRDGGDVDWVEGDGYVDMDFGACNLYPGAYRIEGMIRKNSNVEYFDRRAVGSFAVVSAPDEYQRPGRYATTYVRDGGCSIVVPVTFRWSVGRPGIPKPESASMAGL